MNKIFKNITFPVKLMVVGLLPMIFMLFLAVAAYQQQNEKIQVISATTQRIARTSAITTLIDQLQLERRHSFVESINNNNEAMLISQRSKTDVAVENLRQLDPKSFAGLQDYTFLNDLQQYRQWTDARKLHPTEVMNYYTNTIFRLNALSYISVSNIPFLAGANDQIIAQRLLSEMGSSLGTLRAQVYMMLYNGAHSNSDKESLHNLYEIYNSFIKEYNYRTSTEAKQHLNEIFSTTEYRQMISFLQKTRAADVPQNSYDANSWWTISGKATDDIKALQRDLLQKAERSIYQSYTAEKKARDRNLILLILMTGLVIFTIAATIKSISDSLNRIRQAVQRIAKGATDIELDVSKKDVIGNLATSIQEIDTNNKILTRAAAAIGSGNFDIDVTPRSDEDLLGNAIASMKNDLYNFTEENRKKIWIQSGLTKINDCIKGDKTVEEITENVINSLTEYVNADVGLFYVSFNQSQLAFFSSYAVNDPKRLRRELDFGQGLTGQAAVKQELILMNDVPDEYIRVSTALGEASPRQVVIVPLVHNDITEGVIELGALAPLSTEATALLHTVSTNLAIALQAAKNKARLQELLEETQSQTEELQAQHSELENMNTELEAQAQKLQASEEELRVQQEELLQANQELEERSRQLEERNQLIVERNLEIQKKAEELEISTKYKSEFLANMSHELRTPLNSILLLSRLLSENNDKNLTADQVEYAQVIQSSGNGLLSLIDEILDLSKIESGKMELEYQVTTLQEIVDDMRSLFTPVAKDKNLQMQFTIAAAAPREMETDKLRIEQILKNLLSNALKFTTKGSVNLEINTVPENKNLLAFIVRDTGIGIPKEKHHQIFEAFQQADGSTRRKFGGTGLGLSISRELAKLLGGEIKLVSEPGKGSEFTVYIPVRKLAAKQILRTFAAEENPAFTTPSSAAAKPEDQHNDHENLRGAYLSKEIPASIPDDRNNIAASDKAVLIVEDDTSFAKALLDFSRSKGYKGIVTVRGDEALQLAKEHHPLGILLDVQLPVKSGWEVMEDLKNDPQTRHIPVHIMSSHQVKKESLVKGAIDFINKPVAFEQMQDVFRKIESVINNQNRKVLIIEENTKHAEALSFFLGRFNINAAISGSIDQGIAALNREEINCVILDMGIPDVNAYRMLEQVKENAGLETLPIIIFTGKSLSKAEEEKIRQYADSIVIKTAHSYKRILDEVTLFLHLVEENNKPAASSDKASKLGSLSEVLKGKTILIADDDVRNIFSLTRILEGHGMNVLSATDGKEALKVIDENTPDIVLMDIMMPEMDGYETMRIIRSQFRYKHLPIIAVTAKAMVGDREKCIQAGASDYISKPVDIDQLLSLLRVWIYDRIF